MWYNEKMQPFLWFLIEDRFQMEGDKNKCLDF